MQETKQPIAQRSRLANCRMCATIRKKEIKARNLRKTCNQESKNSRKEIAKTVAAKEERKQPRTIIQSKNATKKLEKCAFN